MSLGTVPLRPKCGPFISSSKITVFFNLDLQDWVQESLSQSFGSCSDMVWTSIFMSVCFFLWNWRNKGIFEEYFIRPTDPSCFISQYAINIMDVRSCSDIACLIHTRRIHHVRWIFPPDGWCKLNTDGASKGNPGIAGCGGVIRDSRGLWLSGYCMSIGCTTAFKAELWGILKGMELAWNFGIRRLMVESDSLSIISFLNHKKKESSSCNNNLIRLILGWKSRSWNISFMLTLREGNSVADFLANRSITRELGFHAVEDPHTDLKDLLFRDLVGVSIPRVAFSIYVSFVFFFWAFAPLNTNFFFIHTSGYPR